VWSTPEQGPCRWYPLAAKLICGASKQDLAGRGSLRIYTLAGVHCIGCGRNPALPQRSSGHWPGALDQAMGPDERLAAPPWVDGQASAMGPDPHFRKAWFDSAVLQLICRPSLPAGLPCPGDCRDRAVSVTISLLGLQAAVCRSAP